VRFLGEGRCGCALSPFFSCGAHGFIRPRFGGLPAPIQHPLPLIFLRASFVGDGGAYLNCRDSARVNFRVFPLLVGGSAAVFRALDFRPFSPRLLPSASWCVLCRLSQSLFSTELPSLFLLSLPWMLSLVGQNVVDWLRCRVPPS